MKLKIILIFFLRMQSLIGMEHPDNLNIPTSEYVIISEAKGEEKISSPLAHRLGEQSTFQEQPDNFCLRYAKIICIVSTVVLLGGAIGISLISHSHTNSTVVDSQNQLLHFNATGSQPKIPTYWARNIRKKFPAFTAPKGKNQPKRVRQGFK